MDQGHPKWESELPIIFLARITSTQYIEDLSDDEFQEDYIEAEYKLVEMFRGEPKNITMLKTRAGGYGGSCGIPFTSGDLFLIFTNDSGNVDYCSGTQHYHHIRDKKIYEYLRNLPK